MKIYHLKVSLSGYHEQPINRLHRIIEISEDSTFEDLHHTIFEAFDRFDEHLYTYFISKKDCKNIGDIMDSPSITNPHSYAVGDIFDRDSGNAATTKIKDANLQEKDVFYYWFDFGDDWWHRIRVNKITTDTTVKTAFSKVTKKVGKSPAQYEYEEGEHFNDLIFDDAIDDDFDFEGVGHEIDQARFNELGFDEQDMQFFMQTMSDNSSEAMQKIVNKYGIDRVVTMLEILGIPNISHLQAMLKNMPIIHFLESCEASDLTLQQEHDLLKNLIDNLQTRLENIEHSIAQTSSNKKGK